MHLRQTAGPVLNPPVNSGSASASSLQSGCLSQLAGHRELNGGPVLMAPLAASNSCDRRFL